MDYEHEVIKLFVEDLGTRCNKVELPKKWIIEYVCRSERVSLQRAFFNITIIN